MKKTFDSMKQTPAKEYQGRYIVLETGEILDQKPESMTQLTGNYLVPKTHPRIVFRGEMDYLTAILLEFHSFTAKAGLEELCSNLGEIVIYCQQVMASEALSKPLKTKDLFGLSEQELHDRSHHPLKFFGVNHPLPNYKMGKVPLRLNSLRALARKTELAAIRAYEPITEPWQADVLVAMNRLSSGLYVLYCSYLAETLSES